MRKASYVSKLAFAALLLCAAAGCSSNPPEAGNEPSARYPLKSDSRLVTHAVVFQAKDNAFGKRETGRLNAFLGHFFRNGGGKIEVRQAASSNMNQAKARLDHLRSHMLRQGVRGNEISVQQLEGSHDDDGPIILSFTSYTVKTFGCPNRNVATAHNPSNVQHPDMGCSIRSNIANMIANPADLEEPRAAQPADAMRRSRVLQSYRAGLATEAARGDNEAGGSIRALGGN